MNPAHTHLILNHIPVVGIGFGLLLLAYALIRKSDEMKRAGLGFMVLIAIAAVGAQLTGEPAEEAIEHLPGVVGSLIERHEESALLATIATGVVGAIALAGLIIARRSAKLLTAFTVGALAVSVVAGVLMARTANFGGEIRHPEIRANATAATGSEAVEEGEENELNGRGRGRDRDRKE